VIERSDFEQWRSKEVARLLALVEAERRYYQEIVSALPVPLAVLSAGNQVAWANRSFRRLLGLRAEEIRRKEITQLLPSPGVAEFIASARQGAAPEPLAIEAGGRPARLRAVALPHWDDEAEAETLLLLEEMGVIGGSPISAAPAPAIPEGLPAIIWTADAESTDFRTVSGAAEEFLGYPLSHWFNRPGFFEERIHPDDRAATMDFYRSLLDKGGEGAAEFRVVTAAGESFWCRESVRVTQVHGASQSIIGILTNISRRKQLEQQRLSTSRLEAIESLAGRLAHDLNNPLMIIQGYGEEMLDVLGPQHPARADAQEILTAAQRISTLTAKLSELTRQHAAAASRVLVTELLASLEQRLREAAGLRVRVELALGATSVFALAEPNQLREVILALAAPSHAGAEERTRLTVSCDTETLVERVPMATLAPGTYARIILRDDGRGRGPARAAAVFDPIVHPIRAEGLELARAHAVVRQWGGDIACSSEFHRGTTFTIYLPAAPSDAAAAPAPPQPVTVEAPSPEPAPAPLPDRETILVVDDEAGIRGLMRKILRRERYVVLEAASAEEALEKAAAHPGRIQLLLTDVMLPGMSGPELARKLYAMDEKLKVLYISGYTADEAVRAGEFPPGARFLAKPFTLGALLSKVRETLDA
jgi:PAS domain S-box-containing protein